MNKYRFIFSVALGTIIAVFVASAMCMRLKVENESLRHQIHVKDSTIQHLSDSVCVLNDFINILDDE